MRALQIGAMQALGQTQYSFISYLGSGFEASLGVGAPKYCRRHGIDAPLEASLNVVSMDSTREMVL